MNKMCWLTGMNNLGRSEEGDKRKPGGGGPRLFSRPTGVQQAGVSVTRCPGIIVPRPRSAPRPEVVDTEHP